MQSKSAQRQLAIVGRAFVPQVHEWRSGDIARVRHATAEGIVRSVVDGTAWVEFQHGSAEYNAHIPLERLQKIDRAAIDARGALRRNAEDYGGSVVESNCRGCDAPAWGHVCIDPGDPAGESGPAVPAYSYVAGFVRSCNCDEPRADIERDFLVAAAMECNDTP